MIFGLHLNVYFFKFLIGSYGVLGDAWKLHKEFLETHGKFVFSDIF